VFSVKYNKTNHDLNMKFNTICIKFDQKGKKLKKPKKLNLGLVRF